MSSSRRDLLQGLQRHLVGVVRRTAAPQVHSALIDRADVVIERVEAHALSRIVDGSAMRLSDLAESLIVACSTAGRHAARLEAEGLCRRTADPADARAVIVEATPAGRELLQRLRAAHAQLLADALEDWDDDDLATLTALMARLNEALGATVVPSDRVTGRSDGLGS